MGVVAVLYDLVHGTGSGGPSKPGSRQRPTVTALADELHISEKYLQRMLNPYDSGAHFRANDIEPTYRMYRAWGANKLIEYFARMGDRLIYRMPPIRATGLPMAETILMLSEAHARCLRSISNFDKTDTNQNHSKAREAVERNIAELLRIHKALSLWNGSELPLN